MDMEHVSDTASRWGVSERSVRNYCAQGRVEGAELHGKTWLIPHDAAKPARKPRARKPLPRTLLNVLRQERTAGVHGGIYHAVQIDLTYNSNHIEGSRLTHEQTRHIFETASIVPTEDAVQVDDIIETVNHFRAIDRIIDRAEAPLNARLIKELHRILKSGTRDAQQNWFRVGDWKAYPNEVGGRATCAPEHVDEEIAALLSAYRQLSAPTIDDLLDVHVRFERIHPFQDGSGRVGRLILFKECLRCGITPFIITDELKLFYYRGIAQWDTERGYLRDTCLTAQDDFKERLRYFRIEG